MKLVLTGDDLTLDLLCDVASGAVEVEIGQEANERLERSRQLVYDLVEQDIPVYGFNTGVGWNKDQKIDKDFFGQFNRNIIFSHSIGVFPEASEEEVRAVMAIRLNCLLRGNTGIQPSIARRFAEMLNCRMHPVIPERGSVGEGDIAVLSHIGLAMIGEGCVNYQGCRMLSSEAHKKAGFEPIVLGPKDALAIINSNAFSAGQGALVLKDLKDLADIADIVYSVSLEGLNGNTSPLDPAVMETRRLSGQMESAARISKYLEGSYIYRADPSKPVQDPLCYRGAAHVHGSLRDATQYVEKYLLVQMNSDDGNPCLLLDQRRIVSGSNFETTTLAAGFEMLGVVLSHVSRISCFRMIKICDPDLTGLTRFLSHDNGRSHCFGTIQKTYTLLDTEIRHLSNPCSVDYIAVAGEIEDHANNTPYIVQKLRKMTDNLKLILGIEMMHGCQAIDLRKEVVDVVLGAGTRRAWQEFRKIVPFYKNERPLAPDIQQAYGFIKNKDLLVLVRDQLV